MVKAPNPPLQDQLRALDELVDELSDEAQLGEQLDELADETPLARQLDDLEALLHEQDERASPPA